MSIVQKPLLELAETAQHFLDEGEFEKVAFLANRAITMSSLWGGRPVDTCAGVALRIAAQDLTVANSLDRKLDISQKQAFRKLIEENRKLFATESPDYRGPWESLSSFKVSFWDTMRGETEGKDFTPNPAFVGVILSWAVDTVSKKWSLMKGPKGSPFLGVLNELEWAIRAHRVDASQMGKYALIQALAWTSEYVRWKTRPSAVPPDNAELTKYDGLVQKALAVLSQDKGFEEPLANIVHEAMNHWRTDFDVYFDLFMAGQKERSPEGSEEEQEDEEEPRHGFRRYKRK